MCAYRIWEGVIRFASSTGVGVIGLGRSGVDALWCRVGCHLAGHVTDLADLAGDQQPDALALQALGELGERGGSGDVDGGAVSAFSTTTGEPPAIEAWASAWGISMAHTVSPARPSPCSQPRW